MVSILAKRCDRTIFIYSEMMRSHELRFEKKISVQYVDIEIVKRKDKKKNVWNINRDVIWCQI